MSDKLNLADRMAVFLTEKRAIVISALALVVAIIITVAVWGPISDNMAENSAQASEDLDEVFSNWYIAEEVDKAEVEADLMAKIDDIIAQNKNNFTTQRALYVRGQVLIEKEMWKEASADFALVAEKFPESYIAPVALFNAASCLEEAKDLDGASALYNQLVEQYKSEAAEVAEAIFNIARIAETQDDTAKAIEFYEILVNDYSTTDWKNIAKTRILMIK